MGLALGVIAGIPATIGTSQAISAQKRQDAAAKKSAKFRLSTVLPSTETEYSIVLRNGFCYLVSPDALASKNLTKEDKARIGHPFLGYYFTHPGWKEDDAKDGGDDQEPTDGIVSTISDDPPMLNWVFVDDITGEVRHGTKTESVGHMVGPWGWDEEEVYLTLDEEEMFVAVLVEEESGNAGDVWQVFWDFEGDGSGLPLGKKWEEVQLRRRLLLGYESKLITKEESRKG